MKALWAIFLVTVACSSVHAGTNSVAAFGASTNRTVITSDTLDYDYKRSIAVFRGNVHVDDGQVEIKSEQLTVIATPEGDVRAVTAIGKVRMRQGDRVAHCAKAVYAARLGEVVLTGDVKVSRGKDFVSGDRITFNINEDRMKVEPGYLVIYPDEGKEPLKF